MDFVYISIIGGALISTFIVLFIIWAVKNPPEKRDKHNNDSEVK